MRLLLFCLARYGISLSVLLTTACKAQTPVETPTPAPFSNSQRGNRQDTRGNSSEETRPIRFEPESVTVPLKFSPQVSDAADVKILVKTETSQSTPVVIPVQIQPSVGPVAAIKIPVMLQIQTEQARVTEPSPTPRKDSDDHIGGISSGDLLTLVVALAAYIATVRFFMAERLKKQSDKVKNAITGQKKDLLKKKRKIVWRLVSLVPADALFVATAILLVWRLFDLPWFEKPPPSWAASLFTIAICYLAALHFMSWCDTGGKLWEEYFGKEEEQPPTGTAQNADGETAAGGHPNLPPPPVS